MTLKELILEGRNLAVNSDIAQLKGKYNTWCNAVRVMSNQEAFSKKEQDELKVKMHYTENEYSENDTYISIKKALNDTLCFLEERISISNEKISKNTALMIIEKILDNFYMYYRTMYRNPIHKKGTLTQDLLNKIQIRNECKECYIHVCCFSFLQSDKKL